MAIVWGVGGIIEDEESRQRFSVRVLKSLNESTREGMPFAKVQRSALPPAEGNADFADLFNI
jgi:hypothetical protein